MVLDYGIRVKASPNPKVFPMKNCMISSPESSAAFSQPIAVRLRQNLSGLLIAMAAAALLAAGAAQASNLLVNPSFEANSGHVVPVGWTYFSPPPPPNYFGDYWIESAVPAHAGTLYFKVWGALYNPTLNNVSGIYQEFGSAPGSSFQAGGWLYTRANDVMGVDCRAWVQVEFYGSTSNLLALYKSDDFSAAVGTGAWFQYEVTSACDISVPVSVGDPYFTTYAVTGTVSQLVAPVGTTKARYRFAYLQAGNQGGSCYLDAAVLDQVAGPLPPVISSVFPLNMIFANPNDGITFNARSPSGFTINNNAIRLVVNGVDVSGSLAISGSISNKNVVYSGLQSNLTYTASITVTDSFGFSANMSTYFETTWVGIPPIVYLWEAEDFDYTNGLYLNHPDLCSTVGNPNCYFGKVGVEGVDEHNLSVGTAHLYRTDDPMGTSVSGDYLRKDHVVAGVQDYRIDPFLGGEWLNYTRDWSNGTFWVVARLATGEGLSGSLTLSRINPDTTTTDLGTFTVTTGRGWSSYDNVYLKDTNGNLAPVTLNGRATLRLTSGGNLLPGCLMLVAGQIDSPQLSNLYPTGTHPFEYTNALSFTVTASGATIPASGIKLTLDGTDASSGLVVGGSASARTVVYPGLLPNALHTAMITVTNSLNHGIRVTNSFDTFSQDNYMVEAEDFDYDGGQYVNFWYPSAYYQLGATTNVDYHHSSFDGERYTYRTAGIPEDLTHDFLRDVFIGNFDYDITWFGAGDWANVTRVYPTGSFYVYGRFSGLGSYTMSLDQVVDGQGTTSQTTKRLGRWSAVGRAYNLYDWAPLMDETLSAPQVVTLDGLATLRISTDGNTNPNYFMLVPASGITLTAAHSGGNVVISFPTQTGVVYRVFSRNGLSTGNWTLLTTVLGNGAVKSVNDPASGAQTFYRVVAP
jgi:hypothetical protein